MLVEPAAAQLVTTTSVSPRLITTQTVSNAATMDFTGLGACNSYQLVISGATPATDDVEPWLRVGTGAGPTWQATGYDYGQVSINRGGATATPSAAGANQMVMLNAAGGGLGLGNAAGKSFNGVIEFSNPTLTQFPGFSWQTRGTRSTDTVMNFSNGGGNWATSSVFTGVRFMLSSGNIASAIGSLYCLN